MEPKKKGCGCGSKPDAQRPMPQDVREFMQRRARPGRQGPAIDEIVAGAFDSDRPVVARIENIRAPGPNGTTLPPLY
ncbi:hypothetical protein PLCT2_00066 [Planctomycetaceae bacterium]|nr:hypothetical protein PLCT2_00066 [Planctomycetaceae bacterium]